MNCIPRHTLQNVDPDPDSKDEYSFRIFLSDSTWKKTKWNLFVQKKKRKKMAYETEYKLN